VLHEVSLRIDAGRHTAILGPNGCGKSTFVKLINRELYPVARAGDPAVRVLGQTRWDVFALREQLGLVAPDLQRDLLTAPGLIAEDAVVCGYFASQRLPPHRDVTAAMRRHARAALVQADAAHLAQRPLATLSTGEARRVLIARALVSGPEALVLDEPAAGLDPVARRRFLELVARIGEGGTTLVLVTHHVEEILPIVSQVVLLKDGGVAAAGPKAAVLTGENLSAVFDAPVTIERVGEHYYLRDW